MRRFTFPEVLGSCPLCASSDIGDRYPPANIRECLQCGYRFVSPRPSQEEIAAAYSALDRYDNWVADNEGRSVMWKKRWRFLGQYLPRQGRLLDVGAGIGTFMALARADGWNVEGTELSASAIALAKENHDLELRCGQLEDFQWDDVFDVVTLWHVLEHVPDPSRSIAACRTLLRPGGLLVVAVPNDADERHALVRLKNRRPIYEPLSPGAEIHLSHFTVRVLAGLLESRGFRLVKMSIDNHYPHPSMRTNAFVAAYRLILAVTKRNFGQTTLAIAVRV